MILLTDRKHKNNSGYSLIELIFVMALLTLFGIATFTLIFSGSDVYKKVLEKKTINSELRVALSYVNTKLKQNDELGCISIEKNPTSTGNALVIHKKLKGRNFETWIFWNSGRLLEDLVLEGNTVSAGKSFEIAEIESFEAKYWSTGYGISVRVAGVINGKEQEYSSLFSLKSGI